MQKIKRMQKALVAPLIIRRDNDFGCRLAFSCVHSSVKTGLKMVLYSFSEPNVDTVLHQRVQLNTYWFTAEFSSCKTIKGASLTDTVEVWSAFPNSSAESDEGTCREGSTMVPAMCLLKSQHRYCKISPPAVCSLPLSFVNKLWLM